MSSVCMFNFKSFQMAWGLYFRINYSLTKWFHKNLISNPERVVAKIRRSCSWLIVGQLDSVIEKLHLFDQKHILFVNIHLLVFDDTFETSTTRLLVWPERLPQQWQRHSAVLGKAATCNMPRFSAMCSWGPVSRVWDYHEAVRARILTKNTWRWLNAFFLTWVVM